MMKKQKMSEFVKFIPGINPTRAKKQYGIDVIEYYDQNAFEYDYGQRYNFIERVSVEKNIPDELALKEGDVVISNSMQLATIVGKENAGRVLPLNFTKVEFVDGNIDKRYFIYIFNEFSDIKRQKEREMQGNGKILRIPIKSLQQLEMPVISLSEQKKMGKAYFESLKLQAKLVTYAKLVREFNDRVLEERILTGAKENEK